MNIHKATIEVIKKTSVLPKNKEKFEKFHIISHMPKRNIKESTICIKL